MYFFFFSSRRRHTRWPRDWSSDVCSSDLDDRPRGQRGQQNRRSRGQRNRDQGGQQERRGGANRQRHERAQQRAPEPEPKGALERAVGWVKSLFGAEPEPEPTQAPERPRRQGERSDRARGEG